MRSRAREAGIWFGEQPTGPRNSITDISGVKVGHCTIIKGSGRLDPGNGPVRTGVTAILPHDGNLFERPVKASYFDYNGCGGLGGALQIREFGLIDTPIALTNTMSMGTATTAVVKYMLKQNPTSGVTDDTIIPIVSECDDSWLNDSRGLHVREEHVNEAIENASSDVEEGCVGGGTGMSAYDYKGGIGTSSRTVTTPAGKYTVGTLVMSNHGEWQELRIDGVPVGSLLGAPDVQRPEKGSIVMVVGTDAPLDARQLGRIARRAVLGLAVTGSASHNGSGDIVISFSTANLHDRNKGNGLLVDHLLRDGEIDSLFRAAIDSTTESIVNSLFKAETMEGRDGHVVNALPIDRTIELMKEHGRLIR
ncbi:MAG: aminopeptidase [Euryarchaeota archaeon RBG_13_57_23]|nr:MAG: aminopeptidase [Euryarchaeota archaeon RBG_13_57_23]